MIDFSDFYETIHDTPLAEFSERLREVLEQRSKGIPHGKLKSWLADLERFADVKVNDFSLTSDEITIEPGYPPDPHMIDLLKSFHPWRKGPYRLLGIPINSEWRSDWKWQRLAPHLQPLRGTRVLDVGCGNGYHCWRMRGEGASLVVGIDPTLVYLMQFLIVKRYLKDQPVFMLPLKSEEMPGDMALFDAVFSMGVLYHRRSPMDHLEELRQFLKPGGQLVLETLVVEGDSLLMPEDRYAQMRNVWFIPGIQMLKTWVRRAGFTGIKIVDVTQTTIAEQRSTEWMTFQSLANFLDPVDASLTIEGYPAPTRAILIADKS